MSQHSLSGAEVIRLSIAVCVLSTVAVGLRLLARWKSNAPFACDDWCLVGSLLPFYSMIACSTLLVTRGGLGQPIATLENETISTFFKILMATMVTYSLTITSVKISLLMLYRRIFATHGFRMISPIVGVICLLWCFMAVIVDVFQCSPMSSAFEPLLVTSSQCINVQNFYWGITGANLALDVILLSMPLYMISGLHLPKRQKICLGSVFLLGGLVCIAGIMRVVSIGVLDDGDITRTMSLEYAWSQVEPATAILCASIVTYRPLFVNVKKDLAMLTGKFAAGGNTQTTATVSDWTDMENSRSAPLRWAVASDFMDRDSTGFREINTTTDRDFDRSGLTAKSHEMKPLPRRPEPAPSTSHMTIYPGRTVLRLNGDGSFRLDSPV